MATAARPADSRRRGGLLVGAAAALVAAVGPAAGQTNGGTAVQPAGAAQAPATTATPVAEAPLASGALGPLSALDVPRTARAPDASGVRLDAWLRRPATAEDGLPIADRPWRVQPFLGIEVMATNNVFQSNDARSDIVTSLTAGLNATVSTPRLFGTLNYEPTARLYSTYSSQNRIDQNGSGRLLAAIVPGSVFVDIRGAAAVVPTQGRLIPGSVQPVPSGDATQVFNLQVTPYLVHRFGSAATLQAGYSFQYSEQSDDGSSAFSRNASTDELDYTADRGFAVLRSGEDLGRLALQGTIDGTAFTGDGVYDDAHRFIAQVEGRYAILPTVAVLLEAGYENIEYGGTQPRRISGPTWSFGTRLTPDPDSIIIVRYGRRDGFNSVSLNAGIAIGARTDLFATYSERLSTSLGDAQDLLSTTTLDALGNPVDAQTGAPAIFVNPFFSVSNALFRTRTGSLTIRHTLPRDVVTLSATWQDRDPVSAAPGTVATAQTGTYATLSWARDVAPRTLAVGTVQYGRITQDNPDAGDEDVYTVSVTVVHRLTEQMAASVQAGWTRLESTTPQSGYTEAVVRAGLRRTF
jgi:uncharacterized protein (PEP-CTERM system associated)